MPGLSLKYRIAVTIFVLEAVMMALVLWQTLSYTLAASRMHQQAAEQIVLRLLGEISRLALLSAAYADLQPYLERVQEDSRVVQVMVADDHQRVVASTTPADVGSQLPTLVDTAERYWRMHTITNLAGDLGLLAIQFSNAAVQWVERQAYALGGTVAALGMLTIAAVGIAMGSLLTRRLGYLTQAAQQLATGECPGSTALPGHDEIARLGQAFDSMVRQLATEQQRLAATNSQLQQRLTERQQAEVLLEASERRYRDLFEHVPVSLWEEDFSGVKIYIDTLRQQGITDVQAHFIQHPETLQQCINAARVVDVNTATLELYQIPHKGALQGTLRLFNDASLAMLRDEISVYAAGGKQFTAEYVTQTVTGEARHVSLRTAIAPGYETTWGRVLVSLVDITQATILSRCSNVSRKKPPALLGPTAVVYTRARTAASSPRQRRSMVWGSWPIQNSVSTKEPSAKWPPTPCL